MSLTARRLAAEITQEQAARMAGVSLKTYQRIENGTSDIKLRNYTALIKGLNTTDLDLCLDCLGISPATPWDVAAAARVLPPEARTALVTLIMMLHRHNAED
jgi:transcriptional regulator with XRE-family HTH domain